MQQKPTLVSKNELVVRRMDNSFKKAACRIEDRHIESICERIRKILLQAECTGQFRVGYLTNKREAELVEGQIKFQRVVFEHRWITFLVQPTNTNSRAEFWVTFPDDMDGKNFLDMVKEAHAAIEPEGVPYTRGRRKFLITEKGDGTEAVPSTVVPLVARAETNADDSQTPDRTKPAQGASIEGLEKRIADLSMRSEKVKAYQARRDAIQKRRSEIQHTLDLLANEDQELLDEYIKIGEDMPDLEAIEQTVNALEMLLKK
jgi:hypothetical protein